MGQNSGAAQAVPGGNFAAGQQGMAGNFNPQYAQYYAGGGGQGAYGAAQYGVYGNFPGQQASQNQSQGNEKN